MCYILTNAIIIAKRFRKKVRVRLFTHMHTAEKRMDMLHTPLGHIQLNNMMLTERESFLSVSQLPSSTHLNILWRVSRDVASTQNNLSIRESVMGSNEWAQILNIYCRLKRKMQVLKVRSKWQNQQSMLYKPYLVCEEFASLPTIGNLFLACLPD